MGNINASRADQSKVSPDFRSSSYPDENDLDTSERWRRCILSKASFDAVGFRQLENEIEYKINHRYLLQFTLTLVMSSTFQLGWILAEHGQVIFILAEKLKW